MPCIAPIGGPSGWISYHPLLREAFEVMIDYHNGYNHACCEDLLRTVPNFDASFMILISDEVVTILRGYLEDESHPLVGEEITLLLFATMLDLPRLIQILVRRGADVSKESFRGLSPLQYCAQKNDLLTVATLVEGQPIDVIDRQNSRGMTPFLTALQFGSIEMATALYRLGINPGAVSSLNETALHFLAEIELSEGDDVFQYEVLCRMLLVDFRVSGLRDARRGTDGKTASQIAHNIGNQVMLSALESTRFAI